MAGKEEDTPFVIDFKQSNQNNYGTAASGSGNAGQNNNINNSISPSGSGNNNTVNAERRLQRLPSKLYCLHGKKSHLEVRDHCHHSRSDGVDVKARKKLLIASGLCLFFMICEIIGGVLSNSLAIATDAAHLLTDFASFMISLFAIWIAGRPPTQRMSFGWYRAEVIGALASVFMIWVITAILVWLAIQRVINGDFDVDANIMLITSGLAIVVNIIMGVQLQHGGHGHSHGGASHKKKPKTAQLPAPTSLALPKATEPTSNGIAIVDEPATCPISPTQRLEDGVSCETVAELEIPGGGLRNYSYQNSVDLQHAQQQHSAEITAAMAETAPGAHHHGGAAANEAVNMNVRAAFIHVMGDILQSVGVFVAALVIYFRPDWAIADPICTFVFSIIVLFTTFSIMKDALLVLMEGTPSYMEFTEVFNVLEGIEGVHRVHNLRIWALSINKVALSVHLAIGPNIDPKHILERATTAVHLRYNFFETTIQIEEFTPQMENCKQCTVPET